MKKLYTENENENNDKKLKENEGHLSKRNEKED